MFRVFSDNVLAISMSQSLQFNVVLNFPPVHIFVGEVKTEWTWLAVTADDIAIKNKLSMETSTIMARG